PAPGTPPDALGDLLRDHGATDSDFLAQFKLSTQKLPSREGMAVENKVVHLPDEIGVDDLAAALDELEDELKSLEPPVFRSNLLVDSDVPYGRRMSRLRAATERLGWNIRRWRRHGPSPTPGQLLSPANAIQVRVSHVPVADRASSVKVLGETVIPATVDLGRRRGLAAHICAVADRDAPESTPIELSLLAWEKDPPGQGPESAVADRLAAIIGRGAFPEGSTTSLAERFSGSVEAGGVYQLLDRPLDWARGATFVHVAHRRAGVGEAEFLVAAAAALNDLAEGHEERDGAIAAIGSTWLCLWEHRREPVADPQNPLRPMEHVASFVPPRQPEPLDCKGSVTRQWEGVRLDLGSCVRLNFVRRGHFKW
ncbi:MAG: hypothetical protein AAF297_12655, partial [Planctomycetota bacterium]